ncbi:Murein hydrolase activator NlpD precursor [Thiorhodovibrio winogradskyi]|uniref:Murein hydrolase activator NlpD n=1 Tax=Thiorhodovibrio winogradskyi TaxID=77007 RepID=A0ABZ0S6L6_9GAMM|nr:peptidoglycan DD-metalloendopeptidase family protein [Thiorhodovibrio winogradskyi]
MMRDYKFRVRGSGFRRQPDRRSRRAIRLGFLALTAGLGYALAQVLLPNDPVALTPPSSAGAEVIKLPLPQGVLQGSDTPHQPTLDQPTLGQGVDLHGANTQDNGKAQHSETLVIPLSLSTPTQYRPQSLLPEDQDQTFVGLTPRLKYLTSLDGKDSLDILLANVPRLALEFNSDAAALMQPLGIDQATFTQSGFDQSPRLTALPPTLREGPFRFDYRVQPGDTLGTILESQNLPGRLVYQILDHVSNEHRHRLEHIRPGETIRLHFDQALDLHRIEFKLSATERLLVSRAGSILSTSVESEPTEPRRQCLTAVVDRSLYGAAKTAGIPDQVTQRAINIFRHQVNFARQTRKGDKLSVLFEQIYAGDEPIKTGPVLAVEFTNGNKHYAAVRYTTSKGVTDYYSADGKPIDKGKNSFLRTPLDYTRVSSKFSMNRLHPILRRVRPHPGVDLAAPAGRRILAAADGRVHFRGRKSGYGNIVILRHGSRYETRYAHLMRFATGIANGSEVKRGQTIGYVGQTGLATGPHLHYEIHINGRPVDPLTAKLPFLNEFDDREKARFRKQTRPLLAELQRTKDRTLLADARSFTLTDSGLPTAEGQSRH